MNTGNLKNIVVLKDLPSNLVEEAIKNTKIGTCINRQKRK